MPDPLIAEAKELIFILGAYGTGDSGLSNTLQKLGYGLPESESPPYSIAGIHRRFLHDVGSHWTDPCPLPRGAFESRHALEAQSSIHKLLESAKNPLLVDDPGVCRLFPLWAKVLEGTGHNVSVLEIIRHPLDVFDSSRRQHQQKGEHGNGISSREHANMLWWRCVSEARGHIAGIEFLTIPFENLKNDFQSQLEVIHEFLEVNSRDSSEESAGEQHDTRISDHTEKASTDSERFLCAMHHRLLCSKAPLPDPAVDVTAPTGLPAHPWPDSTLEAISLAGLKHLSGTIPHSGENTSILIMTPSREDQRPIDTLFISDKPTWPSHIYRVKNPVDALNRRGLNALWIDESLVNRQPEVLERVRRVIIHRLDWGSEFRNIVLECRKMRIPVGYDIDDLLFIPELIASGARDAVSRLGPHEVQRWIKRSEDFQRCVREADFFIGATQSLTDAAREFNQDCRHIFNGFSPENLAMATLARECMRSAESETINLGYASGTATHRADFDEVAAVIWQLMLDDPRLRLTVVGTLEWETRPPAEIEDRISVRPLVPHVNLPFELARFDINLTPLKRNAFCDAKSPLKFFESGLVDVPTIATRNPTYESIEAISNGCILADGPDTWREHILRLADETALRQHLGKSARRTALENFDCDLAVGLYEELPSK